MVYRVRPIRWDLLVNPVTEGLRTEAAADARKFANLGSGIESVGQNIRQKKVDAENKRRSDRDFGLRQQAFDLRKDELEANRLEREGDLSSLVDAGIDSASALKDNPNNPQVQQTFSQLVQAMGGEERAALLTTERARGCGGAGQPP